MTKISVKLCESMLGLGIRLAVAEIATVLGANQRPVQSELKSDSGEVVAKQGIRKFT